MHTVLAFDIGSEKRRARMVKVILARLTRVQESVFEGHLDEAAFLRMRSDLEGVYEPEADTLRYWRLCRTCARRTIAVGQSPLLVPPDPPFRVIG